MPVIERLDGLEILDSRGRPTVKATCVLEGGVSASASVPSGASTGAAEALELRDHDPTRYRGQGCRQAVANIAGALHDALAGRDWPDQAALDGAMIALDGTANKSRLGANGVLAVSVAFARAVAAQRGEPLYAQLARLLALEPRRFPRLTINLFSGGKHAGGQVPVQDVLIVPASAESIDASLAMASDVYQSAAELVRERYGMRLLTADEGGLAPPCESAEAMMGAAVEAIEAAGYTPGTDVMLALDVAASHFYNAGQYQLDTGAVDSAGMIEQVTRWVERYPIVSVEDALHEEDWDHWPALCRAISPRVLVLGDDLLCTNTQRIERAIESHACDALLLKVNQVGTLTEAAEAYRLARNAGWQVTISVRSGETEDDWAADLVVGWQGDQFKNGSITQSERLAKYNRLLALEAQQSRPMVDWPAAAVHRQA